LIDLANAVNPQMKLSSHLNITDFTIKDHFERFSYSISNLGISKHYTIAPSFLQFEEGKKSILRCMSVLRVYCDRKSIKPVRQFKSTSGRMLDSKSTIRELELRIEELEKDLSEKIEENARLQEAVIKLDEINRKMVVDLMKELSARSQEMQRKQSMTAAVDEEVSDTESSDGDSERASPPVPPVPSASSRNLVRSSVSIPENKEVRGVVLQHQRTGLNLQGKGKDKEDCILQ
jgi:hypothetical protein